MDFAKKTRRMRKELPGCWCNQIMGLMEYGVMRTMSDEELRYISDYRLLNGKKLLILAGGANLVSLVKRAQEFGVYTIVTDYYSSNKSPAKLIANEYWDISWNDIDALEIKCREKGVDGVTTGYSEAPVEACIELCQRLNFPCYCTKKQLDFTRDKVLFKKMCRENGVPTVKEYNTVEDVDAYPVIVKPVDRAGSIGVSVAHSKEELIAAYDYAMSLSYSKHVIIEKYISGTKIDLYYEIIDGNIRLLSSDDVIFAAGNGTSKVVQSCWLLPSRVHALLKKETDEAFHRLLQNLGIKNGYIFFSGFEDHGDIMFFEAGFRLCGGHLYEYLMERGERSNLDIFIYHALLGSTHGIYHKTHIYRNLKCVVINIYAKAGKIGRIAGFDKVMEMDDCKLSLVSANIGDECHDDKAILTKVGMVYFCNDDSEKLERDIVDAYKLLEVSDINGRDMIYDRIDSSVITSWWD